VSPSNVGPFDIVIAYRQTTIEDRELLTLCEGPFLHVGNLSIPEGESPSFEFCIRKGTTGCQKSFERCIGKGTCGIRSVIVRSLAEGTYSFPGSISGHDGNFLSTDGQMDFAVDLNSSFLNVLVFGSARPTCAFRVSALAVEGWKSVELKGSPEEISMALSDSRQFQDQNARFVGTYGSAFSELFDSRDDENDGPRSLGFDVSRALRETGSDMAATLAFPWDSHSQSGSETEVMDSKAVWIAAGSSLGAILIVIVVIVLFLGWRHRLLTPASDATESDMETNIPADSKVSSMAVDPFLSGQNALSADRKIPGESAQGGSDGAAGVSSG
jgi:hypothetical protein